MWWGESWELPRSPGGGQWPDPAPAPHQGCSLCAGQMVGHLLKCSRASGSNARILAWQGKGHAWTDKGAGSASESGLCSFVPARNVAKWGLGDSLGFAGAGCTTRSKGQLGWGMKAGEGQGLTTVTPCVLFIPVSDDTRLRCQNCLQAEHPKTSPAPHGVPQQGAALSDCCHCCHDLGTVAQPRAAWGQVVARSWCPDGLLGCGSCGSQGCGCCCVSVRVCEW